MAALGLEENELKCAICCQFPTAPRKLPGCMHSFCENCIFTFVSSLRQAHKLGTEFECPVCKLPSQAPEDSTNITLEWVRTMELDSDCQMKVKPKVEAMDNQQWCSQCEHDSKAVIAEVFCRTCHEHFCRACSETLHSFKINAKHYLINTDDVKGELFHDQALQMFDKFEKCTLHPDKLVVFHCYDDDKLFCFLCATKMHKNCKDVRCISDIEKQYLETDSTKLSNRVTGFEKHIQAIKGIIKDNETENKKTLEDIQQDIQETKQKVIQVLDVLEENLKAMGKAIIKEISIKNLDEVEELDKISTHIKIVQYLVDKIVTKISPDEAYICIHEAKYAISELEKKVIREWSSRKKLGMVLMKTTMLESFQDLGINETKQLASIGQTELDLSMPVYHKDKALKKIEVKKIGIHTCRSKGQSEPTYNNVVFLPNGHCLLTDSYNGCCYIFDEDMCSVGCYTGTVVAKTPKIDFSNPRYASYARNGIIAISEPFEKKISFVTADETMTYKGDITCCHTPMALHMLSNTDIAVSWKDPVAFGILSGLLWSYEKVYFTADKSGRHLKSFDFMAVDEKRRQVIQPCIIDKVVYCFNCEGEPVFRYCSENLQDPKGVAVDGGGNIYICETELSCIHILSPDGQAIHIIKENCPAFPLAVGFKEDGKTFAVTKCYGEWYDAHLFTIDLK